MLYSVLHSELREQKPGVSGLSELPEQTGGSLAVRTLLTIPAVLFHQRLAIERK